MTAIKKHKNLIIFIVLTFGRSVFLGIFKFFLWSYLKELVTLQEIVGYISLGGTIAYLVAGALAYAFTKKKIVLWATFICIVCLIVGYFTHYTPFFLFAALLTVIGFMYGLWLTIKSVILSTEILVSGFSETAITGMTNIAVLVGYLLGSYLGFATYAERGALGFLASIGLLILLLILTLFLSYDKIFVARPFISNLRANIPHILKVTETYFRYLVPISVLWSVSTVMGQKMLEIGINTFDKVPQASIMIIVISISGAVVGNIISAYISKNKKLIALIFIIIFGWSIIMFPYLLHEHTNYLFLKFYSFMIGLFFGIAVNIIEGRYFFRVGEDQQKEYGAAAYGLISSIVMFFVMIIADMLTNGFGDKFAFFFCGIIVLINIFFMGHLDKHPDDIVS